MARETKVGLLAGLAFIICFAVILANRGATVPPGLTNSFLPQGTLELPKVVQRSQPDVNRVARNRPQPQPAIQPQPDQFTANPVDQGQGHVQAPQNMANEAPATGAQVPVYPNPTAALPASTTGVAQYTRPAEIPAMTTPQLEQALASRERGDGVAQPPTGVPAHPVALTGSDAMSTGARPTLGQTPLPIQGDPYTVKPSDTLSSIAASHYGTKSKQGVETIFDANRGVLTDINSVKSGTVLTIPKRATPQQTTTVAEKAPSNPSGGEIKTVPVASKVAEKPGTEKKSAKIEDPRKTPPIVADASKAADKKYRWYQVQKNDRYASIARDQLGDAGRWHEVFEMNKDKFPNPQQIREGVRIKLPMTPALASKEKKN